MVPKSLIILIVIISLILICIAEGILELKRLKLTRYSVYSPKISGSLSDTKFLVLSDIHCTYQGRQNNRLIKLLNKSDASAILIAGDLVNGRGGKENSFAPEFLEILKKRGLPIYYTFGNHENKLALFQHSSVLEEYTELTGKYCTLLNTAKEPVILASDEKRKISLYGVNLPLSVYHPVDLKSDTLPEDVSGLLPKLNSSSDYNILMIHDPAYFPSYVETGADLVICGHVHGGIVRIPFLNKGLLSPRYTFFPKYDLGTYKKDNTLMIVSSGIGWHNIPVRFFNRPEIIEITLTNEKEKPKL